MVEVTGGVDLAVVAAGDSDQVGSVAGPSGPRTDDEVGARFTVADQAAHQRSCPFAPAVGGIALYRSPRRLLDPKLRELGQTRVGWCVGSRFVYSQHRKACRTVGIGDEQIEAIEAWETAICFNEAERAVLAYTDALSIQHGRVPDGVFSALQAHLSDEEILELTYIVCTYAMHGVMSRALRLEYDADPPVLVEEPGDEASLGDEYTREEFRRALRIVSDGD